MNERPPLNEEAIFAAGDVIHKNFGATRKIDRLACTAIAERAVEAYLAAAPVDTVSTVEELDALPFSTVAMFTFPDVTRKFPFELGTLNDTDRFWQQPGDPAAYTNSIMARYLPARVLYRPEVDS